MTHWRTRVLQPPGIVQTVTVNGDVAGNIVSWWNEERRFVGYWFGRPFWGKGIGTRALTQFLDVESTDHFTPIRTWATRPRSDCWSGADSGEKGQSTMMGTSLFSSSCTTTATEGSREFRRSSGRPPPAGSNG